MAAPAPASRRRRRHRARRCRRRRAAARRGAGVEVADALVAGGVTAIEITMTVPRAVELIAALAARAPADVIVGAGTVLDAATARSVIDAGAAFVVSPVLRPDVVDGVPRRRSRGDAGLLDADRDPRGLGGRRRPRQGVPRHRARPGVLQGRARARCRCCASMPTGGVTRENAGDVDPGRRDGHRRRYGAGRSRRRARAAGCTTSPPPRGIFVDAVATARGLPAAKAGAR